MNIFLFLARLHEVQRAIVVTTVKRIPVSRHTVLKFSRSPYFILVTTGPRAFILAPWIPCRVSLHSTTSDPRVHAQGWGKRSNSSTNPKVSYKSIF